MPISPDAAGGVPRDATLVWRASDSATSYHLQVAANSAFATVILDTTIADTLLQLSPLAANRRFFWRVNATNEYGTSSYSVAASFMTGDNVSAVKDLDGVPATFQLFQNYPNPFNPTTTISFSLPQRSDVRLVLVNVLGKEVMNIANGNFEAGVHRFQLDASGLASGLYFYRMEAGEFHKVMKMILNK